MDMKTIMMINSTVKRRQEVESVLSRVKTVLEGELQRLNKVKEAEYSGWFVLLKVEEEGRFKFVGLYNPNEDESCGDNDLDWDLSVAIPKPETVPEFTGW